MRLSIPRREDASFPPDLQQSIKGCSPAQSWSRPHRGSSRMLRRVPSLLSLYLVMTLRVWTRCCLAPSELRRLFLFLQTLGSAHENQGCQRAARPSGATRPTVQRNQGPEKRARGSRSHLFSTGPAAYFLKGQKPPCRRTSETEARLGAGFQQGDLLCWCRRLTWPGRQFRCHAERTWKNWCNPHENSMCWGSASA